jgi:hypothetical protein
MYCLKIPRFPVFLTNDYKDKADIIKNDSFYIFVQPMVETVLSDTNYIIPVEIGIYNYIDDSLSIKVKKIEAYLKNDKNKNEVFKGIVNISIDTVTANLQIWKRIPFTIEFKDFNRNCVIKITDFDNYNMDIILYEMTVNELYFPEKKVYFICRTH